MKKRGERNMARPRKISENDLLKGTQKYFDEVCKGNVKLLKFAKISVYLSELYGMEIGSHIVKSSKVVREYIKQQKLDNDCRYMQQDLIYKPLDVKSLLSKNKTQASLTAALTALDARYEELYLSAVAIQQEIQKLTDKNSNLKSEIAQLKEKCVSIQEENTELKEKLRMNRAEQREQSKRISELKKIVSTYVYSDLANELLKESKMLKLNQPSNITEAGKREIIDVQSNLSDILNPVSDENKKETNVVVNNTLKGDKKSSSGKIIQMFRNELDEL